MSSKLQIVFEAVNKASPAIEDINKSLDKFGNTASAVAKGALLAIAAGATVAAVELVSAAKAAMEAERNMALLTKALQNSGQATQGNIDKLILQSEEMQNTTKFSDDAIQSLQTLALNMGRTADQTAEVVLAGTNFATAMGIDAQTAVKGLSGSYEGQLGILGRLMPELKNLTEEQLKAGEAIRIVGEKFKGFAETDAKTLEGTLAILGNKFGDLQEEIGKMFTENEGLKKGISGLAPILGGLKDLVVENKDTLKDLAVFGFLGALKSFNLFMQGVVVGTSVLIDLGIVLDNLSGIIDMPELPGIKKRFEEFGTTIFVATNKIDELAESLGGANYAMGENKIETDKAAAAAEAAAEALRRKKEAEEKAAAATAAHTTAMKTQREEIAGYRSEIDEYSKTTGLYEYSGDLSEGEGGTATKETDGKKESEAALKAAAEKAGQDAIVGMAASIAGGSVASALTVALSAGLTVAMGPMGQAIGQAAGPLIDMVVNKTRAEMDDFFIGIGAQVERLADNLDDFILSFITEGIPAINKAFFALAVELPANLILAIPEIIEAIIEGFIKGIFSMVELVGNFFSNVWKKLKDLVDGSEAESSEKRTYEQRRQDTIKAEELGLISEATAVERLKAINAEENTATSNTEYLARAREGDYEARAMGGPVSAGNPYLVGENGPEIIVPRNSGTVIPNSQTNTGGSITMNVAINTNNPSDMVNTLKRAFKQAQILGAIGKDSNPFQLNAVTF